MYTYIEEDMCGNRWVTVPGWVAFLIRQQKEEIYKHYLLALNKSPEFITHSSLIHRQIKQNKLDILTAFFNNELSFDDFKSHYPGVHNPFLERVGLP